jgi:hypothetical protein
MHYVLKILSVYALRRIMITGNTHSYVVILLLAYISKRYTYVHAGETYVSQEECTPFLGCILYRVMENNLIPTVRIRGSSQH